MARPSDPTTRIELLRAAETVFVEHGLDRAKVEDITALAGRSKGSFYLHFESKEDAFRQIVESLVARLASFLDQAAREEKPVGDVAAFVADWHDKDAEIFEYVWQNRGLFRLVFEGGQSAGFAFLIDEFAEREFEHVLEALRWGVRHGYYRADLDVELAGAVIAGAYDRIARELVRAEKRPDLRAMLKRVQHLVLRGIASDATCAGLEAEPAAAAGPAAAGHAGRSDEGVQGDPQVRNRAKRASAARAAAKKQPAHPAARAKAPRAVQAKTKRPI